MEILSDLNVIVEQLRSASKLLWSTNNNILRTNWLSFDNIHHTNNTSLNLNYISEGIGAFPQLIFTKATPVGETPYLLVNFGEKNNLRNLNGNGLKDVTIEPFVELLYPHLHLNETKRQFSGNFIQEHLPTFNYSNYPSMNYNLRYPESSTLYIGGEDFHIISPNYNPITQKLTQEYLDQSCRDVMIIGFAINKLQSK